MKCIDCLDVADPEIVGICHDCGAAVCAHDAVVRPRVRERPGILFDREEVALGRALRCSVCDAAVASSGAGATASTT